MKQLFRVLLPVLLAIVPWLSLAAVLPPQQVVLRAYLSLDEQGKVTAMDWPHMDPKAKPLTDRLEKVVRSWEFEPGSADGVAVPTQTGLTLVVGVGKDNQGALTLSILEARTGAVVDQMVVPRYPFEQAKAGNSATLVLALEVDESGKVVNTTVQSYRAGRGKTSKVRQDFEAASREAAMLWKFSPERVAGKAMASRFEVPFDFCINAAPCNLRPEREGERKAAPLPSGTAMALDSVVKIKTRTELSEI